MATRNFFLLIAAMIAFYHSVFTHAPFWVDKIGMEPHQIDSALRVKIFGSASDTIEFVYLDSAAQQYAPGIRAKDDHTHYAGDFREVIIGVNPDITTVQVFAENVPTIQYKLDKVHIVDNEFPHHEYSWIYKVTGQDMVLEIHFDSDESVSFVSLHTIAVTTAEDANYNFGGMYYRFETTVATCGIIL